MKRVIVAGLLITALTACGRIGFESIAPLGDGALADGRVDAPIDPSLIAWYPMDDDPATGANDVSGHARHAVCGTTGCPAATPGIVDGGFAFAGTYLVVADDAQLRGLTRFTIAYWMRVSSVAVASGVSKAIGTSTANSYDLGIGFGNAPTICSAPDPVIDDCDQSPASPAPLSTWFHLAATWDGATMRLYVDGTNVLAMARLIAFDTHDVQIGCDRQFGSLVYCLDGALDDVRIYDRDLAMTEIQTLAKP